MKQNTKTNNNTKLRFELDSTVVADAEHTGEVREVTTNDNLMRVSCSLEGEVITFLTEAILGEVSYFKEDIIDLTDIVKRLEPFSNVSGSKNDNACFKGYIKIGTVKSVLLTSCLLGDGFELKSNEYGVECSNLSIYNYNVSLSLNEDYLSVMVWSREVVNTLDTVDGVEIPATALDMFKLL